MTASIGFAVLGGCIIGLAAVLLYASLGRIAGISGIAATAMRAPFANFWAVLFIGGLGLGGLIAKATGLWDPASTVTSTGASADAATRWLLVSGGVLVGFGTRLGSGCTSGHGVCGMARLSKRSFAATLTFVAVGMLIGTLVHSP